MALPGAHLQGHLVLLVMQVSCWVVITGGGRWCWVPGPIGLGLLETHEQLEGWLGHWVWHIVGDINLRRVGGPSLRGSRGVVGGGKAGAGGSQPE